VEAWEDRERKEHRKRAWLAVTIINGVGFRKKAIRLQDLLPREPISLEEVQRDLSERQQRFEAAHAGRGKTILRPVLGRKSARR
jgi:hypothetical protein